MLSLFWVVYSLIFLPKGLKLLNYCIFSINLYLLVSNPPKKHYSWSFSKKSGALCYFLSYEYSTKASKVPSCIKILTYKPS